MEGPVIGAFAMKGPGLKAAQIARQRSTQSKSADAYACAQCGAPIIGDAPVSLLRTVDERDVDISDINAELAAKGKPQIPRMFVRVSKCVGHLCPDCSEPLTRPQPVH